jgi:hypothetical protein
MVASGGVRPLWRFTKLARASMDPHPESARSPRLLRLLFGLREPVDRRTYALVGFGLMLAKYAIDAGAVYAIAHVVWTPLDYLSPLMSTRANVLVGHLGLAWWLVVWTLPFTWIGFVMTLRRALDAGISGWSVLLYFVPVLNYVWMLVLCVVPTRRTIAPPRVAASELDWNFGRALLSILAALPICGLLFALTVYALRSYGNTLFLGAPMLLGAVSSFLYNRGTVRPVHHAVIVGVLAVSLALGALLFVAAEGAICILMAAPLALPMSVIGAAVGRTVAQLGERRVSVLCVVPLCTGGIAALESALSEPAHFEVRSSVEVDAPPQIVWNHVVSFSELPEPDWALFRVGLAYPVRARIEGSGVGAVRRCEFSTGAFVEPITVWDEPRRLAFDVVEQPQAMHEWSPYRHVHPPHLDGYFASERGEFRLIALDGGSFQGGRTRLEGSTWYQLRFGPASYWRWWSDFFVHRIHARVLDHVRRLAEADAR